MLETKLARDFAQRSIANFTEELIMLCEVRGTLDKDSNTAIESKIQYLTSQILQLKEVLGDQAY